MGELITPCPKEINVKSEDDDIKRLSSPSMEDNDESSSMEDALGPKQRSKHSYKKSFELANQMTLVMSAEINEVMEEKKMDKNRLSQPNTPYKIQITPPCDEDEDINYEMIDDDGHKVSSQEARKQRLIDHVSGDSQRMILNEIDPTTPTVFLWKWAINHQNLCRWQEHQIPILQHRSPRLMMMMRQNNHDQ